ncbi:MAG: ABC transporter permease [Propionibacteriaceae bacterium]|jgi:ABC-2 type transport system permease protein|nr:ABC transporter permease [Propionibacteriaceae bacterium]
MPAFRLALKLISRKRTFIALYIIGLTALGLVLVGSVENPTFDHFEENKPDVAVIDRDHSEVSAALTSYLGEHTVPVTVADEREAIQEASARNVAPYIVIIPEHYGDDLLAAFAADPAEPQVPQLETVINYRFFNGYYLDALTDGYLAALRLAVTGYSDLPLADQLAKADAAAAQSVDIEVYHADVETNAYANPMFYFQWLAYPLTAALMVLVSGVFSTVLHGEVRRRNLASPLSSQKLSSQVALGTMALVLISWAIVVAAGLLPMVGGFELLLNQPANFAILSLGGLVYAMVCAAIGFLVSQFGLRPQAENGIANIVSLSFAFLSGVFMGGTAMFSEGVVAVAHFIPTYWYSEAVLAIQQGEPLGTFWGYTGIVALFGVAFYCTALLVGRLRVKR